MREYHYSFVQLYSQAAPMVPVLRAWTYEMVNRVKEHRNPLPIILAGFPLDWLTLPLKERIYRILSAMLQQQ